MESVSVLEAENREKDDPKKVLVSQLSLCYARTLRHSRTLARVI